MPGKQDSKKKPSGANAGFGDRGGAGGKWCSDHKPTTHNATESHQQGAPRPQGNDFIASAVLDARNALADDDNKKPGFQLDDEFMASTKERTSLPNSCGITMLVDSAATEHLLDDELIPGLEN